MNGSDKMMEIDHFLWQPVPDEGHLKTITACSQGIENRKRVYINNFKKEGKIYYFPLKGKSKGFLGHILFNNPQRPEILLSRFYQGENLDEKGRGGQINHTAVIRREFLEKGILSLSKINECMREFERKMEALERTGEILNKLEVKPNDKVGFEFFSEISNRMDLNSAHDMASALLAPNPKPILFITEEDDLDTRFKYGQYLIEMLNFHCGLKPISFCTQNTDERFLKSFDLFVLEKGEDLKIERDLDAYTSVKLDNETIGKRLTKNLEVYSKIKAAYCQ